MYISLSYIMVARDRDILLESGYINFEKNVWFYYICDYSFGVVFVIWQASHH